MKKLLILSLLAFYSEIKAQNVGIGNPAPAEKLDVTGNINVTGTIKANGVDGTANQVLKKNNAGNLTWSNLYEYKNFKVFDFTTTGAIQTFTVPAGVTKLKLQAWGGGGSGLNVSTEPFMSMSGAGGGYAEGDLTVIPGNTINVIVANNNAIVIPSEQTIISFGVENVRATSGNIPVNSSGTLSNPAGGVGLKSGSISNFYSLQGQSGQPSVISYFEASPGIFYFRNQAGNGGDAGYTSNTGAKGGIITRIVGTFTTISYANSGKAVVPGGGGSVLVSLETAAPGRAIIYW